MSHSTTTSSSKRIESSALRLEQVSKSLGRRSVIQDFSTEIRRGERVALIGPSGSGKTTLLRLMSAAIVPDQGQLQVLGQETSGLGPRQLRAFRSEVGILHQRNNLIPNLRVIHNVLMGNLGTWSWPRALLSLLWPRNIEDARRALDQFEIEDRLWDMPDMLSGGQQQRVALARLSLQKPQLILADEPVTGLDQRLGQEVIRNLQDVASRSQATLIVSSHALEWIDGNFDRVIAIRSGKLWWSGRPEDLNEGRITDLYQAIEDEPNVSAPKRQ